MVRSEAEAIFAQGREPVVDALLALSARLEAQDGQLAALAARVEELEQRLKRDSRNSSLPPSHDPPWLGKRGRSRGTGRKQGAQPGHPGHGRALFPIERVTDVVDHWPERCGCGHVFGDEERGLAAAPVRHQVAELPPLAVEISEHRLQRLCCPGCGRTVRAELPAGVPRGCFGPKLEAAIAALTVRNRLSRRQLVELMEELFGCPIAVGTIDAILSRTAETLAPVYDELLERTRAAGALNIDETGWYLGGEPRTLWGAFSKQTALLRIAPDRGKQHLHGLLGDAFAGVVGSDRFSAYNSLDPERRQVCWSHLRRDFTFHADLGLGAQETFGLDGLEVTWNVFQAWKQFQRDGDRAALQQRVEAIKQQMRPLLEWGSTGKRQRHVHALAKNLLKLWPALWTFADVADVEPTNNAAERGLRAAVIYRKLSFGSRSQGGERTIERLLSVDQTCRLQRRSLYAYLSDALMAQSARRSRTRAGLRASGITGIRPAAQAHENRPVASTDDEIEGLLDAKAP